MNKLECTAVLFAVFLMAESVRADLDRAVILDRINLESLFP